MRVEEGSGGASDFERASFKSVKCNDTSKDIYRNQIDKSKVFLAAIMDPMNKPMTDPTIKTMSD